MEKVNYLGLEKKYRNTSLKNDKTSLGMTIGVYVNTFHKETDEYLVNLEYLESILPKFGLKMDGKPEQFNKLYKAFESDGNLRDKLSDNGKLFSFLNVGIKIIKVEDVMFGGGVKDENLISRYISVILLMMMNQKMNYSESGEESIR